VAFPYLRNHELVSMCKIIQFSGKISRTHNYIQTIINSLHSKKSSDYDLITVLTLKSLPPMALKYLTQLFNSALFLGYFPAQWKVVQIILHGKLLRSFYF
jgi:hypothetical protein